MAGKKQNMAPMWKKLMKNVDLDEPTSHLDHVYLARIGRPDILWPVTNLLEQSQSGQDP